VATGYLCIDDEVDAKQHSFDQAALLCESDVACVERVAWSQDVAERNCPDGDGGADKGYGTARICAALVRRVDGFYDRADIKYEASFNRSLANHMFWSCNAICIYDIDNEGVVYQWKGSCWKMQTKYSCITVYTSAYSWALEYASERVCPSDIVETPAPTTFECAERQKEWNEEIALTACDYNFMGSTDKGSNATTCAGYEDYQYRLDHSLANRVFLHCDAWCVYDIYKNAYAAFIWKNTDQCYRPITSGLCIGQMPESRKKMTAFVQDVLCESTTGEPTEAPTCIEQSEWSEDLMDELCTVAETAATYKHYNGTGRAAVPCDGYGGTEDDLKKSLAMGMYQDCSSWCVYDYYSNAQMAWKWSGSRLCWKFLDWGSCHWDYSKKENNTEWEDAKEAIRNGCTYSPTLSPTDCMPLYTWSEERAEELCPSTIDFGSPNRTYGAEVCDDDKSKIRQAELDKSLANDFYDTCASYCVYDYDTIMNNIKTNSSDYGGFIWKSNCWKWVTKYLCFTDGLEDFQEVSLRAVNQCDQ